MFLQKENIYALPILHYTMECAAEVRLAFNELKPDCVAVELAETMQDELALGASRLPDLSVCISYNQLNDPIYYMIEPCDACFEALRSGLEGKVDSYCIDLDVDYYPYLIDHVPDPYAIQRIGLMRYYEAYRDSALKPGQSLITLEDKNRELYMAKRLKELSLRYDKVLFVGGFAHIERVLGLVDSKRFPELSHAERPMKALCTLTEDSVRDCMAECGYISTKYEAWRDTPKELLDRQKLIYSLYKEGADQYKENQGNPFHGYHLKNTMKFARNYALVTGRLLPSLFQQLSAAKGCVDHNYAYEVWELATRYLLRKNVDGLSEMDLTPLDIWGHNKLIRFHLREKSRKQNLMDRQRKKSGDYRFHPPSPFSICSYPPEDLIVEGFGEFLKKKGTQLLSEEAARTIPFSTSLEDGIDTRETIRHWAEKKLYVKTRGKPPGGVGSVVMIFDEDSPETAQKRLERYPWHTTWLGEHAQESDMAFYATPMTEKVVGPGISRCEYGGFMMSYPPRRMLDVWSDPDYISCRGKSEVLLAAAIDYAVKPVVVYVASSPPRSIMKSFAKRFGKKVVYIPIGQLSPVTLNKIRVFHVLDGHDRRSIADEFID